MNNYLLLLLIAHVLGDYYSQSESIAVNKNKNYKSLLMHCLVYTLIMIVLTQLIENRNGLIGSLIASLIHAIIDVIKYNIYQLQVSTHIKTKRIVTKYIQNGKVYIGDQVLHLVSILAIDFWFVNASGSYDSLSFIGINHLDENLILRVVLVTLLLMKPVNITFKKVFSIIKPVMAEQSNFVGEKSVGRLIGNLERLLIFILLLLNQYGAIGLVFTAKSITRYNKIVEDKQFGEYYLLGTLYSILATLILYLLVIKTTY